MSVSMKRLTFCAIILSFLLCGGAVPFAYQYIAKKPEVHITVFVHGSVFSAFFLMNPSQVINDSLKPDSLYVRTVARVRSYDVLEQDQILQKIGFHSVSQTTFDFDQLTEDQRKKAALHAVPAYLACADTVRNYGVAHKAYTFGHLGLLSPTYRKFVAEQFYDALCKEIECLKHAYRTVRVHVVTHSHGGNVALNLAHWEEQKNQGLKIHSLAMLGCPIQIETAGFAYNPVFERVFNVYSDGDIVQNSDTVSTSGRASYRTLCDARLNITRNECANCVQDIRLHVNNDARRIDHANMWLLGISKKACEHLDPLPIAILLPLIMQHAQTVPETDIDCNIISSPLQVRIQLRPYGQQQVIAQSNNVYSDASCWNKAVVASWRPDYSSRNAVFNFKMRQAIYTAMKDWWYGNDISSV